MLALKPERATRLVLVRHGQTELDGRICGRTDPALSPLGRTQAERAARFVAELRLDAIWASTLIRARETAQAIANAQRLQVATDARLCEMDFGEIDGLLPSEIQTRWPDAHAAWMRGPTEFAFPGGETWPDFRARVLAGTAAIAEAHVGGTVAIVAHGGTLRAILVDALGLPDAHLFRLDQAHGAVSVVDRFRDGAVVRLLNAQ
jgi:alpha-ribazole phosphatase/probable phosphoglycerate mutase